MLENSSRQKECVERAIGFKHKAQHGRDSRGPRYFHIAFILLQFSNRESRRRGSTKLLAELLNKTGKSRGIWQHPRCSFREGYTMYQLRRSYRYCLL